MYTSRTQIQALIRAAVLAEILDDNRDGVEDAGILDGIIAAACQAVDAALGPAAASAAALLPVPSLVADAATLTACHMLYRRMPTKEEDNPFSEPAKAAMERCLAVGRGEASLGTETIGAGSVTDPELKFSDGAQEGL